MKRFTLSIATAGILAAGAVGLAGGASAASTAGTSAADTVAALRAKGYTVQINGMPDAPLSECTVTGIHGLSDSNTDAAGNRIDPTRFTTVYVDVTGPSDGS